MLKGFKNQTYQNVQRYVFIPTLSIVEPVGRTGLTKNKNVVLSGPLNLLVRPSPYRAVNTHSLLHKPVS
jgi:hypothetical protein